jgi:hypothetical protein
MIRSLAVLISVTIMMLGVSCCPSPDLHGQRPVYEAWPVPVEVRVARAAYRPDTAGKRIELQALAGEVLSAQIAVRSSAGIDSLFAGISELVGDESTIPASAGRVRYGGYVPVVETLSWAADPLLEQLSVDVPAGQAQPVWLTLDIPRSAAAGIYSGKVSVACSERKIADFELQVEVLPAVLPLPSDWEFDLFMWQDPTPVAKAHGVELWSEPHWELLKRYAVNMAEHGIKSVATHIIYDPWNGVRGWGSDEMVLWRFPGEYEPGRADSFNWDFSVFDRYVELMLSAGIDRKIDLYSLVMGPWIIPDAHIRYLDTDTGELRTIRMDVGDPRWYDCWRKFLPVLRAHLIEKGWYGISVLGFDEKPEKIMRMIFKLVGEVTPDFPISQAGGFEGDERNRGADLALHISKITQDAEWEAIRPVVKEFHDDPDRFVTFYTACSPWYPNTFLFSTLRESRLMPWIAARYGFDGYARWAVNLFPDDVWNTPRFSWASGDMFFVWPGDDGPLDSMRWELLRQGIQDYEALVLARKLARDAGRDDLLRELDSAAQRGGTIDNCGEIPVIEEQRRRINAVIRELAG